MKVRTDFVTNSSSSSFTTAMIRSFKLADLLERYGKVLKDELGCVYDEVDEETFRFEWGDYYFFGGIPDTRFDVIDCLISRIESGLGFDRMSTRGGVLRAAAS